MSKNAQRFRKRKSLRNPFKIHGGKHYLKWWIIDEFPENYHELDYRELFGGAASVLLNKKESVTELLNDICESRYHLHIAIRDNVHQLIDNLNDLEYTQDTFEHFKDVIKNESGTLTSLEIAVAEYALYDIFLTKPYSFVSKCHSYDGNNNDGVILGCTLKCL